MSGLDPHPDLRRLLLWQLVQRLQRSFSGFWNDFIIGVAAAVALGVRHWATVLGLVILTFWGHVRCALILI